MDPTEAGVSGGEEEQEWLQLELEEDSQAEGEAESKGDAASISMRSVYRGEYAERGDMRELLQYVDGPFCRRLSQSTRRQYMPKIINYLEHTGKPFEELVEDDESLMTTFAALFGFRVRDKGLRTRDFKREIRGLREMRRSVVWHV